MLPAAKVGDLYLCMIFPIPLPGTISGPGSVKVKIEGRPAALMGDSALCLGIIPDSIIMGSTKVMIEGRPAARLLDPMALGGIVFLSSIKVLIG